MGIKDPALIAEKLAIWEGMRVDNEKGDRIGVRILLFIPHHPCEVLADRKANQSKHDAWVFLDTITNI